MMGKSRRDWLRRIGRGEKLKMAMRGGYVEAVKLLFFSQRCLPEVKSPIFSAKGTSRK